MGFMPRPDVSRTLNPELSRAELVRTLRLLGNQDRLRVVCSLLLTRTGELNVTELSARNGPKMSALSQHLAKLRNCGVVAVRRSGHHRYYRMNQSDSLAQILAAVAGYLSSLERADRRLGCDSR